MFEGLKYQDLKILALLDETHKGSTLVHLAKVEDNLVVCKSILKSFLQDTNKKQNFANQIECLKLFTSLNNNHINHFVNTFEDSQKQYLLLSAENGLPLHKLIQMSGNFNPSFIPVIITQIAWIIGEVHEAGIIYRDIKASNFMLDRNGRVTLIDLGLAKKIDKKRTYSFCGTVHAMPPEIVLQTAKQGYSYEFDYYGLGILLYELTVGQPPFGYHTTNPQIVECMKEGLSNEHFDKLKDPVVRDLVKELLRPADQRLGTKGGFKQILAHQYFTKLNLEEIKLIYQGKGEDLVAKYSFGEHQEEIEDFGIDPDRYGDILPADPFWKFS